MRAREAVGAAGLIVSDDEEGAGAASFAADDALSAPSSLLPTVVPCRFDSAAEDASAAVAKSSTSEPLPKSVSTRLASSFDE